MKPLKNMEKYEIYRAMNANLSKAMKAGYYYEAIFIEYAILEDRCTSLLKHAGVMYMDSKGFDLSLATKINKIRSNKNFASHFVRQRIPHKLLDEIETWKRERDRLIHALAKIKYDDEAIKIVATNGQLLVRTFSGKVKGVNEYFDKQFNGIN